MAPSAAIISPPTEELLAPPEWNDELEMKPLLLLPTDGNDEEEACEEELGWLDELGELLELDDEGNWQFKRSQ